jgi:hypothetical protein
MSVETSQVPKTHRRYVRLTTPVAYDSAFVSFSSILPCSPARAGSEHDRVNEEAELIDELAFEQAADERHVTWSDR